MNRSRLWLAFILILLLSPLSHATTVQRLSLDDLIKKAHKIVVGKVSRSRSYWSGNRKLILTAYTVDVEETIKGEAARTVELTTIGGTIGDVTLHVAGMPSFVAGEDAILFLENAGGFSTVVGLEQGKFTVKNGEVSNRVDGLAFPDGRPGKSLNMPVESFKRRIQALLDR